MGVVVASGGGGGAARQAIDLSGRWNDVDSRLVAEARGVEHRPVTHGDVSVMLIEPAGVVNTGDAPVSTFTAPRDVATRSPRTVR